MISILRFTRLLAFVLLVAAPVVAQAAEAPPAPKGIHYVYLIRHGIYDRDTVNTDDRVGSALNPMGHAQARATGRFLASLPVKFHALVSSDFTRARETADDIGAILHLPPVRDSLIHECTPSADNAAYTKDQSAEETALCEGNLQAAWAKYLVPTPDADTHDLLVCHGNVIRWTIARALSDEPKHWSRMDIGNGSVSVLAVRPDGAVRLVMFSQVAQIPLEQQTWSGKGAGWGGAPRPMK